MNELAELNDMLEQHRMFHDDVQLHCFILGGRHEWDRYKQTLRELYKRVRGVRSTETERDLVLVDIDELESKTYDNQFEERRRLINLRERQGRLEELERTLRDTEREAKHFYAEALMLYEKFKNVDEEERRQLDLEAWVFKWFAEVASGMLTTGRPPQNALDNVMKMPKKEREKIIGMIKSPDKLIAWYENEFGENELKALSVDSVKFLTKESDDASL